MVTGSTKLPADGKLKFAPYRKWFLLFPLLAFAFCLNFKQGPIRPISTKLTRIVPKIPSKFRCLPYFCLPPPFMSSRWAITIIFQADVSHSRKKRREEGVYPARGRAMCCRGHMLILSLFSLCADVLKPNLSEIVFLIWSIVSPARIPHGSRGKHGFMSCSWPFIKYPSALFLGVRCRQPPLATKPYVSDCAISRKSKQWI